MVLMYASVPVLGACFGAWLAYEAHWSWIFHFNEPVALLLAIYFWLFFRDLDPPKQERAPFDIVGCIFFCIGIGCLVTAITLSQELDWFRSSLFTWLVILGIPCLLFFILWEWNHPSPLLDLQLLRSPLLSYSLLNLAVLFSSYFGMIILISLWLKIYVNYTPLWISALIGIMGVSGFLAYLVGEKFLRQLNPRLILALSIGCLISSCYYSTYFNVDVDFFHLAVARSLAGLGLVFFLFPLFSLAFASYGSEKSLNIFTLFQVTRALFSSLGAAFYVILWQRRQVFFYERLGENLNVSSQLTSDYFHRAIKIFHLTKDQAVEQLHVLLSQHATSLALNDVFGFMGWLLTLFLVLLILILILEKITGKKIIL
jgi:DHA2 family multidrug resistance protein